MLCPGWQIPGLISFGIGVGLQVWDIYDDPEANAVVGPLEEDLKERDKNIDEYDDPEEWLREKPADSNKSCPRSPP